MPMGKARKVHRMKTSGCKKNPRKKGGGEKRTLGGGQVLPQEKMVLRPCGGGASARYPGCLYSTERIRWVSRRKTDAGLPAEIRDPQESSRTYPIGWGFVAAGKRYSKLSELWTQPGEGYPWYRDIYGRRVFCIAKRFPCFDVFDAMHERRYYHWFFLREGNALTRIFYADESGTVHVTEDVANLEQYCVEQMEEHNYFEQI